MHQRVFSICSKNVHSDWSYECTPNTVHVFESDRTRSGHSKMSLVVTVPCCMYSVRGSADKLSGLYTRNYFMAWKPHPFWKPAATEQNLQNYLVLEGYSQAVWLEILHGRNQFPLPTWWLHFMFVKHILFVRKANIIAVKHTSWIPVIYSKPLRRTISETHFLKWGVWLRWQLSNAVTEFLQGMFWGMVCSHRMTYCFWLKLPPNFINP